MNETPLYKRKEGHNHASVITGFTLVETLVAISILLVVIIGPMTVAQKGIQNAYFARDQLTAVFLAQEAVEAVREKRDDAALKIYDDLVQGTLSSDEHTWDWVDSSGIDALPPDCFDSDKGCRFDSSNRSFDDCGEAGTDCRLRITPSGQYTYDSGAPDSIYTRKIFIDKDTDPKATRVEVVVTWNAAAFGGAEKDVTLETWLYDRYKHYEND